MSARCYIAKTCEICHDVCVLSINQSRRENSTKHSKIFIHSDHYCPHPHPYNSPLAPSRRPRSMLSHSGTPPRRRGVRTVSNSMMVSIWWERAIHERRHRVPRYPSLVLSFPRTPCRPQDCLQHSSCQLPHPEPQSPVATWHAVATCDCSRAGTATSPSCTACTARYVRWMTGLGNL